MQKAAALRKQSGGKRRYYEWHSWLGILPGLLLFIICWSGSFAAISHELDWLTTPAMRVTPSTTTGDIVAIHDAAARAMPDAKILDVTQPLEPSFAADVLVRAADGTRRHVYVDPATMAVTGSTSFFNLHRFFRDFHMYFFGLFGLGKYAVCIFALPLIASLVTALVFYKRWWRRFFKVQLGKGSKAFWSSLHKTAGLWSLWFVLVIGLTGTWYLFEASRMDFLDGKFSYADSNPKAVNPLPKLDVETSQRLSLGELLARTRAAAPGLKITSISLDRGGYFYAEGETDALLVRDRANKIYLDPRDGRVAHYQTARDLSAYWRWSHMADPIHFGSFGGLTTKLIWFAFGIFLAGLSLSGGWLHLKRLQRDTTGQTYWRGTVGASMAGMSIFLFCVAAAILRVTEGGLAITAGAATVAILWCLTTFAVCTIWVKALARKSSNGQLKPLTRKQPA
tara:strand:+ start:3704 stop:5059 length:1356 start_codon:yes stop_codon:yes gene_type:complete